MTDDQALQSAIEMISRQIDGFRDEARRIGDAIELLVRATDRLEQPGRAAVKGTPEHVRLHATYHYPICATDLDRAAKSFVEFAHALRILRR
ncbi:hypothetical protein [Amycolatopsis sp. H20-H5]|uniref:hypothetical protein n=1 Tax=Amycolatopsis sp. H20-H5 TaxID=3046309 RepID=UPI002DB6DE1B|nr:hypothetical protein [Amycolatopsis sp. H20-H5]MEC3978171.1 hypothetical protein [Amycolatopsis sp. H20-H5]